jgi:hypothetical protein
MFYVLFKPQISGPLNLFVTLANLHGRMTHPSAAFNSFMLSKLNGYFFTLFSKPVLRELKHTQIPVAKIGFRDGEQPTPLPPVEQPDSPGNAPIPPVLDPTGDTADAPST